MTCEKYFSANMTRRVETKNYIIVTTDKRKSGYVDQGVDTSVKYVDQGVDTVGIEAIEKYYDKIVEILKRHAHLIKYCGIACREDDAHDASHEICALVGTEDLSLEQAIYTRIRNFRMWNYISGAYFPLDETRAKYIANIICRSIALHELLGRDSTKPKCCYSIEYFVNADVSEHVRI